MHSIKFIPALFSLCLALNFFSCKDDFDSFSYDPNHLLAFSNDTLSLDTILSTIGSTTHELVVYNRHKKALIISSIKLEGAGNTGFRINVNGINVKDGFIENIEIWGNDSLSIFIETTLEPNMQNSPTPMRDQITFTTNNIQQKVILEAYGQDTYIMRGEKISYSSTLPNDKPYLIFDSLTINEGVELTIPAGTVFYLHHQAKIIVRGKIKAIGTLEAPIVFRGDRFDYPNANSTDLIPFDKIPGQWGGIIFASSSYDNEFEYVHVRNPHSGLQFERSDPQKTKIKLKNSIFSNSTKSIFTAVEARIEAYNCEFSNAGDTVISIAGGAYKFIHCTIANYMSRGDVRGSRTVLYLSNQEIDSLAPSNIGLRPLLQADFFNSIIYGNKDIVFNFLNPETHPAVDSLFQFHFCSLKLSKRNNDGDKIKECFFDKYPKFISTTINRNLNLDLRLDSISPMRNVADKSIAALLAFDINGESRTTDEGPDMGAYEWVPSKTP
ncbi:hypothetical protein AwDysgo_04330 [Bacteroidales bacterium]|nr:hypothetical protein AwDysgo_04330 [Bacteroidales bacterium]